ncbi:MAG: 4-(cytidine 5'-diphospho)-2-C-methyl-D-erythritol kinase [Candidatus Melainabacteria bacterium]|nr:4-(cytidine 5'-diphospho)-2-C-methyl-D-erythritol kinase [Candidatus Melainabacteria bacterium]
MQLDLIKENSKCVLKQKAFSKINLGLWIKEKRSDGYHEIETIFLENENLYDEIEIEFYEDKKLSISALFLQDELNKVILADKNLAYRAALLFFEKSGIKGRCTIRINKNIPIEAGLGGASSNAACVLKGLNRIFDYMFHENELLLLAGQIGSDVPFFIIGKTCLGRGRGEILEKLENKLKLDIKIIKPENISVSTKWAYELIDSREFMTEHKNEINNLIIAMKQNNYDLFFKNIFNDFEMVIFSNFPKLIKERKKLLDEGFKAVSLCGSGSALFGICAKELKI